MAKSWPQRVIISSSSRRAGAGGHPHLDGQACHGAVEVLGCEQRTPAWVTGAQQAFSAGSRAPQMEESGDQVGTTELWGQKTTSYTRKADPDAALGDVASLRSTFFPSLAQTKSQERACDRPALDQRPLPGKQGGRGRALPLHFHGAKDPATLPHGTGDSQKEGR